MYSDPSSTCRMLCPSEVSFKNCFPTLGSPRSSPWRHRNHIQIERDNSWTSSWVSHTVTAFVVAGTAAPSPASVPSSHVPTSSNIKPQTLMDLAFSMPFCAPVSLTSQRCHYCTRVPNYLPWATLSPGDRRPSFIYFAHGYRVNALSRHLINTPLSPDSSCCQRLITSASKTFLKMHSFLSISKATSVPGFNHCMLRLLQLFVHSSCLPGLQ